LITISSILPFNTALILRPQLKTNKQELRKLKNYLLKASRLNGIQFIWPQDIEEVNTIIKKQLAYLTPNLNAEALLEKLNASAIGSNVLKLFDINYESPEDYIAVFRDNNGIRWIRFKLDQIESEFIKTLEESSTNLFPSSPPFELKDEIKSFNPRNNKRKSSSEIIYSIPSDFPEESEHQSQPEIIRYIKNMPTEEATQFLLQLSLLLLKESNANNQTLQRIEQLIKEFKSITHKPVISKIEIHPNYRLFLSNYNNKEIELYPLPKALYILFLKHPEGIRLKEISNYKNELTEIYSRISNKSEPIEIKKAIIDLTDVSAESLNQKLSRIKEFFKKNFTEEIARHYYIDGPRGGIKKINLPPDFISFS
jgi:hypothetical protein